MENPLAQSDLPATHSRQRFPTGVVARGLISVVALFVLAGGVASLHRFQHVLGGAAVAATIDSGAITIGVFVPVACTVSTGASAAQPAPAVPADPFRRAATTVRPISTGDSDPALAPTAGSVSAPQAGDVSASTTSTVASSCSDGSTPAVNAEQSSGVISAPGLAGSAGPSDDSDARRIVTSDMALDGRRLPLRVVTVIY
jgi:hypothetical protein